MATDVARREESPNRQTFEVPSVWQRLTRDWPYLLSVTIVATALVVVVPDLVVARTELGMLAVIPAAIGFIAYTSSFWRYRLRAADVLGRDAAPTAANGPKFPEGRMPQATPADVARLSPSLGYGLWAALMLALAFAVPAVIAEGLRPVNTPLMGFPNSLGRDATYLGLLTLVYAALGSYVSVTWRMISRIHLNAVTPPYMMTCALRTVAASFVGFVAGFGRLFSVNDPQATAALGFLIGLFTNYALIALERRARTVFGIQDPCTELPLCMVDGLSEANIDHLHELGIWSVQHLATYEPAELSMRSLLPLNRVIDWIDQAILIIYVREKIGRTRELGIRGVIDFTVMYQWANDARGRALEDRVEAPGTRHIEEAAERAIEVLAQRLGMDTSALWMLGSALSYDAHVARIYELWQSVDPNTGSVRREAGPR